MFSKVQALQGGHVRIRTQALLKGLPCAMPVQGLETAQLKVPFLPLGTQHAVRESAVLTYQVGDLSWGLLSQA